MNISKFIEGKMYDIYTEISDREKNPNKLFSPLIRIDDDQTMRLQISACEIGESCQLWLSLQSRTEFSGLEKAVETDKAWIKKGKGVYQKGNNTCLEIGEKQVKIVYIHQGGFINQKAYADCIMEVLEVLANF